MVALIAILGAALYAESRAHEVPPSPPPAATFSPAGRRIAFIRFVGLEKTREHVILRELLLKPGEAFDSDLLEESVQRLRNLMIFSRVDGSVGPAGGELVEIEIRFVEKWTVLPILRFGGAGDVQLFGLGIYDVNLLGRYLEAGALYENLGGRSSGQIWYRDPRTLGIRLKAGFDAQALTRMRALYSPAGELEGGFTHQRKRLGVFAERELTPWFSVGASLDLLFDRVSEDGLGSTEVSANRVTGFTPRGFARTPFTRAYVQFGRIDYDDFLANGHWTEFRLSRSNRFLGADESFYLLGVESRHYFLIGDTHNTALRALAGAVTSSAIQHQFFLGGLESVRGYSDGQFRGDSYWLMNVEHRVTAWRGDWTAVQAAGFADLVQVPGRTGVFSSFGAGTRILSPRIYRLVVRFDYAFHLRPAFGHGISFGLQQFF